MKTIIKYDNKSTIRMYTKNHVIGRKNNYAPVFESNPSCVDKF